MATLKSKQSLPQTSSARAGASKQAPKTAGGRKRAVLTDFDSGCKPIVNKRASEEVSNVFQTLIPSQPIRPQEVIDLDPEAIAKTTVGRTGAFPRFTHASVYIEVASRDRLYTYSLNQDTLSTVSPWFARTLLQSVRECDERLADIIWQKYRYCTRYELRHNSKKKLWILARAVSNMIYCYQCDIRKSPENGANVK